MRSDFPKALYIYWQPFPLALYNSLFCVAVSCHNKQGRFPVTALAGFGDRVCECLICMIHIFNFYIYIYIYKLNTHKLYHQNQLMVCQEIVLVYCDSWQLHRTKRCIVRGKRAVNVKVCGTYSNQYGWVGWVPRCNTIFQSHRSGS
jgi:hypothetical protein